MRIAANSSASVSCAASSGVDSSPPRASMNSTRLGAATSAADAGRQGTGRDNSDRSAAYLGDSIHHADQRRSRAFREFVENLTYCCLNPVSHPAPLPCTARELYGSTRRPEWPNRNSAQITGERTRERLVGLDYIPRVIPATSQQRCTSMYMAPKKPRRSAREAVFVELDPKLLENVRRITAERGVHQWWVIEEALRRGLPLLPSPEQEVLPESA